MQSFFCLAALWVVTSAISLSLMEQLPYTPDGWHMFGSPEPYRPLHFKVAMRSPDEALFEQTLLNISSPDHPHYGKHMNREDLKDMLRPSSEATIAVTKWLEDTHVSDIEGDGEWISFVATAAQAEELLQTKFGIYRHEMQNVEKVRTLHYSVPEDLHQYIDMIQPTTRFGQMRSRMSLIHDVQNMESPQDKLAVNSTACNHRITPECLKQLYNVQGFQPRNNQTVGFAAVSNFLEEYPRYSDLKAFERKYAPYAIGKNFTWTSVAGGTLNQTWTGISNEANLDMQYLLSIGYPVPVHAYSIAGRGPLIPDLDQPDATNDMNEPYLDFLTYLLKQPDEVLPHTLTTSYGEDEQELPLQYRKTVCRMFGQLGARGISVIFASGDTGVGGACQTNDGKNTTRFLPIFPAACPYVTSVGGTFHVDPEQAVRFSSGGFSDTWPRPSWQDEAVSKYQNILGPHRWQGLYNPNGRGFPDVSAQAAQYRVVDKGEKILVSGTSASAPTFAGIVALLNAARMEAGKPPLGFLNPWLYSTGYTGLNDIVDGGSTGCFGIDMYSLLPAPLVPYASWNATPGWDPVSGLGTPNFSLLQQSMSDL